MTVLELCVVSVWTCQRIARRVDRDITHMRHAFFAISIPISAYDDDARCGGCSSRGGSGVEVSVCQSAQC